MSLATGVGSMPGTDLDDAMSTIVGELPDFVHLPELPARGAAAAMTGRATALLVDLAVDLQPAGWRLTDASGLDHRRAVSTLSQDLDVLEEHTQGYTGPLKIQVTGPWTLAATVERPRGDRALADHGARRELAQSLALGLAGHVADVLRRVPGADVVVQVDEPALPSVLAGNVPTASGFSRHRGVSAAEASEALAWATASVSGAGARPVVHCCASGVPVALLAGAGFSAVSFDLSMLERAESAAWAAVYGGGTDLWPGVVPSTEPGLAPSDSALVSRVLRFLESLDADPQAAVDRVVVTPTCGLAGASPAWARRALALTSTVAARLTAV
ncbi:MAG: methionine synthase [Nocardioidaceae bacterium]